MTDRDLSVIILVLVVGIVVATLDTFIHLQPEEQDGVLTFALVIAVAWGFYGLGKGRD